MRYLEKCGRLNRAIEYLPSDEEMEARRAAGRGLTPPEHAVLLAYSKIWLNDELIHSPLTEDPWIATALLRYFPPALQQASAAGPSQGAGPLGGAARSAVRGGPSYATYMLRHPLSREIVATHVLNSMINRVGSTFVHRLCETTGAKPHEVVRAYLLAREIFGLVPMWQAIEALDNKVADAVQSQMLIDTSAQLERGTVWFLRSRRLSEDMAGTIAHFRPGVEALSASLPKLLDTAEQAAVDARTAELVGLGVPRDLAGRVVTFDTLNAALDIAEVAADGKVEVDTIARIYFEISNRLGLSWMREKIAALPGRAHWQMLAKAAMQDDVAGLTRTITLEIARGSGSAVDRFAAWRDRNRRALERSGQLFSELRAVPSPDAAMLSVVLRELRALA
jgi:glutamate dehydrogenase